MAFDGLGICSLKTQKNSAGVERSRISNFAWDRVERSNQNINNKIFQVKVFKKSEDFILIVFIIFFDNLRFILEI